MTAETPIPETAQEEAPNLLLSNFPICARCGEAIQGPIFVYIAKHDEHYCPRCIDAMIEFNDWAEIE